MLDLSNVSDEELKAELARRQAITNNSIPVKSNTSINSPTGISNPADFIGKLASEWDKQGNKHGTRFISNMQVAKNAGLKGSETKDQFGNELPPTAYEYINQRIEAARANGAVSKQRLRAIQYEAQARYNLPKGFDISGKGSGNWDWAMAKQLNKMPYNSNVHKPAKPATPEMTNQRPNENVTSKQASIAPKQKKPTQNINGELSTNDEYNAAFKRIKNKQASDKDLAMFNKYSEEQLRKMGFGPISIKAIKGTSGKKPLPVPKLLPVQKPMNTVGSVADDMFSMSYDDARRRYGRGQGNNIYFMSEEQFERAKASHNAQR